MIHGTVIGLQARVKIVLRLSGNLDIEIECVVDTGFEGFLTLPPVAIEKLGMPACALTTGCPPAVDK